MSAPYERPTDELRQVRHAITHEGHCAYYVQRKWLVQDGELHGSHEFYTSGAWNAGMVHLVGLNREWVYVKPVWRDLPIVTAEEARQ